MFRQNPRGFHTTLTPELHAKIIEAVPQARVMPQIAKLVGIPYQKLDRWLKRGEEHLLKNKCSIYSQLYVEYEQARAKIVVKKLQELDEAPRNYQAHTWVLERCFREDFGVDGGVVKQILENIDFMKSQGQAVSPPSHHDDNQDDD